MVGSAGTDRSTARSAFNTATGDPRHRVVSSGVLVFALATSLAGCRSTSSVHPAQSLDAGPAAFTHENCRLARADSNTVIRDDPNNTYDLKLLAWYDLGVLDQKLGRTVAASSEYGVALTLDPKYTIALYDLAVLESSQVPMAAVSLDRRACALPARTERSVEPGTAVFSGGKVIEGRKYLNNTIRADAFLRAGLPKNVTLSSQRDSTASGPGRSSARRGRRLRRRAACRGSQPAFVSPPATVRCDRSRRRQSGGAQARITAARSPRAANSG